MMPPSIASACCSPELSAAVEEELVSDRGEVCLCVQQRGGQRTHDRGDDERHRIVHPEEGRRLVSRRARQLRLAHCGAAAVSDAPSARGEDQGTQREEAVLAQKAQL